MAAPHHGNGPNPERTKECVERIEALDRKREAAHMAYMQECAAIASDKKDIFTEAKTAWGLPTRVLKRVIKVRAAERKLEDMRESLEADEQETFDQIRHALGDLADTPLGRAATGEDGGEDLRSTEQQERVPAGRRSRRKGDDALNAAATDGGAPVDNGGSLLADGLKPLHH